MNVADRTDTELWNAARAAARNARRYRLRAETDPVHSPVSLPVDAQPWLVAKWEEVTQRAHERVQLYRDIAKNERALLNSLIDELARRGALPTPADLHAASTRMCACGTVSDSDEPWCLIDLWAAWRDESTVEYAQCQNRSTGEHSWVFTSAGTIEH